MKNLIFGLTIVAVFAGAASALAAVKYEQVFTMDNGISIEYAKQEATKFCQAAEGDPNIVVKKVSYATRGDRYVATLVCHVSTLDEDIMRVQGKLYQARAKTCSKE